MRVVRTLELARVGEWGQDGAAITRKDLADVIETFPGRKPPLTIGHIKQKKYEGPRYGKVMSVHLSDNGNTLVGPVEFSDAANAMYVAGDYDGWSVSIPHRGSDGKRYLHHLALLGETPPKIPGLQELDSVSYDYADGDDIKTYSFEGAIKEQGEALVTEEEAKKLKEENERLKKEHEAMAKEKAELEKAKAVKQPETPPAKSEEKKAGSEQASEFSDRLKKMEAEVCKSRVESLMVKVGDKVPAGIRDKVRGLAGHLAGNDAVFNFSDSGKEVNAKAIDLLGDILAQWPVKVKLGESGINYSDEQPGNTTVDWGKVARSM